MVARWIAVSAFLCGVVAVASEIEAQEFRVETEVFAGENPEPVSESLTIFAGDVIYDFLLGHTEEVTIFDVNRGRIVLLDPNRQLQVELTTRELLEFWDAAKARNGGEKDAAIFAPKFDQTFDEERSQVTLASDRITYAAKGTLAKQPEAAIRFQQFADWYARLNAMRPGNLPPFGRIELNKALADHNFIPEEVNRTIVVDRPVSDKRVMARSHHLATWLISGTDRKRIELAGNQLSKFRKVAPKEYWDLDRVAKKE